MSEHPNVAAVRRSFEAYNTGRNDILGDDFAEDGVLHFAGNNALSGTYRGRDAVIEVLSRANQGGGTHSDVESVLAGDNHMMVFFHLTHERDGKSLDVVQALAIKANAEGKLTEAWFLSNDQRAFDQFWS